ncbi:MAG: hypothetical protein Q9219_005405 [cf. Caloplaca sp. 3 TL-2023]
MASEEDDDTLGSSSSSLHSTQLNDDVSDPHTRRASSSDGLMEDVGVDHRSGDSLDFSSSLAEDNEGSREQSSNAGEASASVKKSSFTRPNKYNGPASTWRHQTAPERQIASSLEKLRAKDLAVHLYNFYVLKRQVTDPGKRPEHGLDQDTRASAHRQSWVSSKSWTAWPMLPELVPRESEANSWGDDALQERCFEHGSHEILRDLLVARASQRAKERFHQREWNELETESSDSFYDQNTNRGTPLGAMHDGQDDTEDLEPTVLADDERARKILQPSLNHVLGKLDTLLKSLHHERSSYAVPDKPPLKRQSMIDDTTSDDDERKRKKVRTGKHTDQGKHQTISPGIPDVLSSAVNQPRQVRGRLSGSDRDKVKSSTRSQSRLGRLGLRDWSDVLGIASICGWDTGVVARAAARCSNLFEEGIVFRTLHEDGDGFHDRSYLPRASAVEAAESPELATREYHQQVDFTGGNPEAEGNNAKVGGVHIDGFLQPIPIHSSWTRKRRAPHKNQPNPFPKKVRPVG